MEKLVITWLSGGESDGNSVVDCLEYESAEALYCHLEEIIKKHIADQEDYYAKIKIYNEKVYDLQQKIDHLNRQNSKKNNQEKEAALKIYEEEIEKMKELHPQPIPSKDTLGTWTFWTQEFISYDENLKKRVISMPEIQTLEEWFESNI